MSTSERLRERAGGFICLDCTTGENCSTCGARVELYPVGAELAGVGNPSELEHLQANSDPIDGRPGWRRDRAGREWYSSVWL